MPTQFDFGAKQSVDSVLAMIKFHSSDKNLRCLPELEMIGPDILESQYFWQELLKICPHVSIKKLNWSKMPNPENFVPLLHSTDWLKNLSEDQVVRVLKICGSKYFHKLSAEQKENIKIVETAYEMEPGLFESMPVEIQRKRNLDDFAAKIEHWARKLGVASDFFNI
jgi:hypothetical protein